MMVDPVIGLKISKTQLFLGLPAGFESYCMLFLAFDLVINDRKKLVLSLETSGMTKSLKICLLGKTDYFS